MESLDQTRVEHNLAALEAALPKKGRILIIPHNYPDPDALASAAAVELLLAKRFHLRGQIVFTGVVSRAENRELLRHFRYQWRFLTQARESMRSGIPCVFVDAAPWSGNITAPRGARPVAVFDHHPMSHHLHAGRWDGLFKDVREKAGASASILYEYLHGCRIAIPKWLATIMAYAIATETLDLSLNATELDMRAYHDLLSQSNMTVMGDIRHAPLPRSYYGHLQTAMQNAYAYGRVAWSHLERVQQPEIVSEIADLLLRAERITWSFCTAIHQDAMLISLRSRHEKAHCGSLIRRLIGSKGSAGGHNRMAAGFVDIREMTHEQVEILRKSLIRELISSIERRSVQAEGALEQMARPLAEN